MLSDRNEVPYYKNKQTPQKTHHCTVKGVRSSQFLSLKALSESATCLFQERGARIWSFTDTSNPDDSSNYLYLNKR